MSMFTIDKQTLSDLNAMSWNASSLLDFFDNTITVGGRDVLYDYFLHPLNDQEQIQHRQEAIAYLAAVDMDKLFDKYMMDDLERYLSLPKEVYSQSQFSYYVDKFATNFWSLTYEKERLLITQSIKEVAQIIINLSVVFENASCSDKPIGLLARLSHSFSEITADFNLEELQKVSLGKNTLNAIIKYDYIFRNVKRNDITEIFAMWYTLDALRSVAKSLKRKQLVFPQFIEKDEGENLLNIKGLYNLALENPIKNDVEVKRCQNIWFLTGANMTGKSTLLKSISACVYLAHLGLPVPADSMQAMLFQGLITTINLGDNLIAGYSHFFNEVRRLKMIAGTLEKKGKIVIVLDELFKGTNYQDAYEATLKLMDSIAGIEDAVFFISSHIAELSTELKKNKQVAFRFLKTEMQDDKGVVFTYCLASGVADEKLGMWFLEREKVFDTFEKVKSAQ
nr:DNA mismatch repair protein MutS [Sphingobacterium phlebotomi]